MKSKIVLSVVATSIALLPMIAFAKAERPDKSHRSAHVMSHRTTTPRATTSTMPNAKPVKMTPAPVAAPKAK